MDTMHLFNTQAKEEKALCGADVPAVDLTGLDEYLERRKYGFPVGNVCGPCKVHAVRWAENRILELEADAEELRVVADELERTAAGSSEEGTKGRRSEADELEDQARELREFVARLKRETGLDVPGR